MFKIVYYNLQLYFLLFIIRVHSEATNTKPNNYTTALDISRHQGNINWVKVKNAGILHVILEATRGGTYQDSKFLDNWNAANEQGIRTNVYHYFIASNSTSEEQMNNINRALNYTNFNKKEHIFVVDIEEYYNKNATPDEMANNLHKLLKNLETNNFKNIFIYASHNYWENKVSWKLYDFSKYSLWFAQYTDKEEDLNIPTTWKDVGWTFWQYTDKGRVDGIDTDVDMNYCKPFIIEN